MDRVVENIQFKANTISSAAKLADALDIPLADLEAARNLESKYKRLEKPKPDGSLRIVFNPSRTIRKIQRRIVNRILSDKNSISWGSFLYGSIPNHNGIPKDYIHCAKQHCGAKSILKLDISSFFDNIHNEITSSIFTSFFKYPEDVKDILIDLCTYDDRIPQGAITSSYLASLALFDCEYDVVKKLSRKGLTYTRYVDDITVSSKSSNYDFSYAFSIIEEMLRKKELPINKNKIKIEYSKSKSITVHGLRVNNNEPRLPRDEVRNIRSNVHKLEKSAKEPNYRNTHAYRRDFNKCLGRVNKLARIGHPQHESLIKKIRKILPLPSLKDKERAMEMVKKLENDYPTKNLTISYRRRFFICHERLNILARRFEKTSNNLRLRLREIKPKI